MVIKLDVRQIFTSSTTNTDGRSYCARLPSCINRIITKSNQFLLVSHILHPPKIAFKNLLNHPTNRQINRHTDKRQLKHILLGVGHRETNSLITLPLVVVNGVVVVVAGVVMAAEVTVVRGDGVVVVGATQATAIHISIQT